MGDWKERLADVDDDYLIGISNKGIVKRAYKDREEVTAAVQSLEDEAVVKVGEETVRVCFPLGESKCSCPSRSICRHVVQAILTLRESVQGGNGLCPPTEEDVSQGNSESSEKVCQEIEEYPLPPLKKALGNRQFQSFVSQVLSGIRPQIRYASIVTVELPHRESGAATVVKLLSPLEYSTCTCHKKELCAHKAAAILWCKLDAGKLTGEELTEETAEAPSYDMDKVREAAEQMKRFLEELLGAGLSRTSPDVLEHMERLAVIGHNAGLARFEGYFRGLFEAYEGYFKRKASFRTEALMEQVTRLYRRVRLLQRAENSLEVRQYAGEFRAEYVPAGSLELIGIGLERFNSGTGYEGETAYFLEENTKKWYTYTNARPVFYEKGKKGKFTEKAPAPWGLGISMEELLKVRIRLIGAKCDERGRLSASQDTRGEITGEQRLSLSDIEGWYYRDFGKLFSEQMGKRRRGWLAEGSSREEAELVFVQPVSCKPAKFAQAGQQLSLPLYDGEGREVTIEVAYSKEEAVNIRYLERLSKGKPPCFAGKLYLKDGRLRMYPVAVFERFYRDDPCER